MVYCSKCGLSNQDASKYCSECGTKLMGHFERPIEEIEVSYSEYNTIILVGQICVLIFLPASLVIGAYLITQPNRKVKDKGWTIVAASVIVWSIYAFIFLK